MSQNNQRNMLFILWWWICGIMAVMIFFYSDILQLLDSSSISRLSAKPVTYWLSGMVLLAFIIMLFKGSTINAVPHDSIKKPRHFSGWNLQSIQELSSGQFSTLVVEIFKAQGEYTLFVPEKITGNADIGLFSNECPDKLTSIARCKGNCSLLIETEEIQSLHTLMLAKGVDHCYFITNNHFTREAASYAASVAITLMDKKTILSMIKGLHDRQAKQLFEIVTTVRHSL
ncbi:restriction endonuclease [Mariprofundus sp. EBB-1]|uniref:restriction endonuclease n=1 Tax=Mariprofundus sp. EBB-1 TaxID=2650971 RepID=UPI000EF29119|nr:restriction endonuclease [Mariprofundus sp. EBB-1]RLL50560.1 restriction endonuclease [Mariprofundus sp. EBB-1]